MVEYVSLHNHSFYSELDGLASLNEYLSRAAELGQRGFGLTDHGSMAGVFKGLELGRKYGVSLIPGVEAYVAPENPDGASVDHAVFYGEESQRRFDVSANGSYLHLTLWAYSQEGLSNLFHLMEYAGRLEHRRVKGRIDWDSLVDYSEGLIVSTGCPSSEISTRFTLGQDEKALDYCGRLIDVFGEGNTFIEVMNHRMSNPLERNLLEKQLWLKKQFPSVGLLATNDCHYAYAEHSGHHEEFLCSQSGAKMTDPTYDEGGKRFAFDGSDYYLKSAAEMESLFPEADFPGALSNTLLIAERCEDLTIQFDSHLKPTLDLTSLPPELSADDPEFLFKKLIFMGLAKRYPQLFAYRETPRPHVSPLVKGEDTDRILKRVADEFEVIKSSDFIGYLLTVFEYANWANDEFSIRDESGKILAGATGAGRGSAAGSLISYCLGITRVDPLRYNLIFERFLTAGRGAVREITYTDGTTDVLNVADKVEVGGKTIYVHQLNEGDEVDFAD